MFQVATSSDIFVQTLQHYRREGCYLLHAFLVMPEHVHLLLSPTEASIERVVGFIKGGFSHRVPGLKPLWQRGFDDRRARSREEFLAMRDYIHQNPVRTRLCASPGDWEWSSAWKGWRAAHHPGAEAQALGPASGPAEAGP